MKMMLVVCAVLVGSAGGCKKNNAASGESAATGSGVTGSAAANDPGPSAAARAEGEKLHAAIDCINRHNNRVFEVYDLYMKSVDPATGAVPKNGKAVASPLFAIEQCETELNKAIKLAPAIPALDAASTAYATALQALETAWNPLKAYYDKGEDIDDHGKKAGELHPGVVAAFKAFSAAADELSTQVGTLNRARHLAKLDKQEKTEGRNLSVIIGRLMLESEQLSDLASARAPDPAKLELQIGTYGKLVDELDAYAGAHASEAAEWGSIGNLKNYSKSLLAATKVVSRKLADKAAPASSELDAITANYNSLVDNYNQCLEAQRMKAR